MEQVQAGTSPDAGRWRGFAADSAVLGIALVWGASYPVAKGALAFAPVPALILYRFAITATVMTALNWRAMTTARLSDFMVSCTLGMILFAIFTAETFGVSFTSATNTAFIISLCTIITPILDHGLAKKFPPFRIIGAAFLSCAGVAVLSGRLTALSWGDGLVLIAAFLRALMVIATKRLMRGRHLSSGALTALQSWTVLLLTCMLASVIGIKVDLHVLANISFLESLFFLSLFCTIGAFYIQNAAVRRSSPTKVSFLMSTEPVFGLIFASILLAEPLTIHALLGGALIVIGTVFGILSDIHSQSTS